MSQNFRSSFNEGGTNGSQLLSFANDAVERDENATRRGKIDIVEGEKGSGLSIDTNGWHNTRGETDHFLSAPTL